MSSDLSLMAPIIQAGRPLRVGLGGYGADVVHLAQEIAAFTDGEKALVYAARRGQPSAPLVLLRDGSAAEMRAHTKEHLQCFMPECPTPSFTTVARRGKRDGFRHLTGGNHKPEGLFHRQGKQALIDWLAATQPDVRARIEVALPDRTRIADVLADLPGDRRFALEVQYASLTSEGTHDSWQARTDDYTAADIRTVWFFGHHGDQMTVLPSGAMALNAVQRWAVEAGSMLWWINPTTGQIATAYVEVSLEGHTFHIPPRPGDVTVRLAISALDDARLDDDGVHTPESDDHDRQARAYQRFLTKHEERLHAAELAAAERARQDAERALRAREQAAVRAQELARQQQASTERQTREWFSSATYRSVLAACDGRIPRYLDHPDPAGAVGAHQQHWQALIYGDLMRGHVGDTISVDACLTALTRRGIRHSGAARRVIEEWLKLLVRECHLVRGFRSDRWTVTDPDTERARCDAAEQERLAKEDALARAAAAAAEARRNAPGSVRCRVCHGRLADELVSVGIHIGCLDPKVQGADKRRTSIRCCSGCAYPLPSDAMSRYHPGCEPWAAAAAESVRQASLRDSHESPR